MIVVAAALRINVVDRFRQVQALQQMASHGTDVVRLESPVRRELVLDGEVESLHVRSLHLAIQSPRDGKPGDWISRRRIWIGHGRGERSVAERNAGAPGKPRRIFISVS